MSQPTIHLSLNSQEAEVLLSLIDLGVKNPNGGGLNVSINAGFFLQRIRSLQSQAQQPPIDVCTASQPSAT